MNHALVHLNETAWEIGFETVRELHLETLHPVTEVRQMCETCQMYRKNWACPPACGTLEDSDRILSQHSSGIIVQTIAVVEDSFDFEAMHEAEQRHKERFDRLAARVRMKYPNILPMGAGACTRCSSCTYPDAPCLFPTERYSSMEAMGLLVSEVCSLNGVPYYYGAERIAYTSYILV